MRRIIIIFANMPVLEKLTVRNFRNIELQELEFSHNLNCISGNNGEGKTNLLDAIYYLSMTKSAFSPSDRFNFRYGEKDFSIAGNYRMPSGLQSRFSIQVSENGEKKLRRDDKSCPKISEHIGVLPVVMVSPSDTSLISESGEDRRRFVNSVLSQLDASYLSAVQQYNRILLQRNRLLKDSPSDTGLLETFDLRLASLSVPVYEARKKMAQDIEPSVQQYYAAVSGGRETVTIEYKSDLDRAPLEELLLKNRDKDLALKYTTAGVQRDDFNFLMDGYPIRRCGSQGQQKSFLVSLKFAQYDLMTGQYSFPPILLLDDLFDKLDMNRVENLLKMVSGNEFGQIFLSDSNKVRIRSIVDRITSDCVYYDTVSGTFNRQ